jgi:hypothetical protein
MATAKINSSNSTLRAQINSSDSSGPKQVSISVPSAVVSQTFKQLNDVNVTDLVDGAMIQYDAASDKFVTKNEILTTTGTLTITGGSF